MNKYEVKFTHVIERRITAHIFAESPEEALAKAKNWEFEDSDEDTADEQGLESRDHRVMGTVDESGDVKPL